MHDGKHLWTIATMGGIVLAIAVGITFLFVSGGDGSETPEDRSAQTEKRQQKNISSRGRRIRRLKAAKRATERLEPEAPQPKYDKVLEAFFQKGARMRKRPFVKKWLDSLDRKKCRETIVKVLEGGDITKYHGAADLAGYWRIDAAAEPVLNLLTERLEGKLPETDTFYYPTLVWCLGRLAAGGNETAKDFLIEASSIDYWDRNLKYWLDGTGQFPREKRIHMTAETMFERVKTAIRMVPCRETMQAMKFPKEAEENEEATADFTYMMIRNFLKSGDSIQEWRRQRAKDPIRNKYGDFDVYLKGRDAQEDETTN